MANANPAAEAVADAGAEQISRQIVAVVRIPLRPERAADAVAAIRENVAASHREAGVLRLAMHRERANQDVLWLVEVFADEAARTAHLAEPHVAKVLQALPACLAGEVSSIQGAPVIFSNNPKGCVAPPGETAAARADGAPPYVVIAIFSVREDAVDAALRMLRDDALPTYEEAGVLKFAVHRDRQRPNQLLVVEAYRDRAAFDFHHQTPHLKKIAAELPPLLAGDMQVIHVEPIEAGVPAKGLL